MQQGQHSNQEDQLLQKLKALLLHEERSELLRLKELLDDPEQLSTKVSPIINDHIDFLKNNFPKEFESAVSDLVDQQIKASQDEIVNLIYPKLDTMIKKYVTSMFQKLKDSIDKRMSEVKSSFSFDNIKRRFKTMFTGVKESDIILQDLDNPVIEEIFIIQKDSGLLVGTASKSQNVDQEVIAGMLTAIKAFVEDAFNRGSEDLEMIRYENAKIFLLNFQSYYFAVSMTGSLSEEERENLSEELITFAKEELPFNLKDITEQSFKAASEKLKTRFFANEPTLINTNK